MNLNLGSISNPDVRQFYANYWPQRQILHEFYALLPEEQYDYRMVDGPERRSDSPRQSLAHILYVQLVYLTGVKTGTLEFTSMGVEHYAQMGKDALLAEMDRIDDEMLRTLTAETFANKSIAVFWGGQMNALSVLYFLHEHTILHIGWNLALMDHLNMARYDMLKQYWG